MKFRKRRGTETELIKGCINKFRGETGFETDKFSLFADKFNKVSIYNGMPVSLANLGALSIGMCIGKFEKDNTFIPSREFMEVIKPTAYVFEITDVINAVNFMKGQNIGNEKKDYMIYTKEKLNFEENALIAIKYKGMVLGVGKFSNGIIINKISKRKKFH